ncbi:MAG: hypothetical protein M3404_03020 [Actinomycetota bacterium]|nr:hypothetical protein [Actinomycetota bacterium]
MALVLAGVLAACNRSSRSSEPTLPPEPSTTTTTIDVSKVPPTIDVHYVQAVMNTLDQLTGDAVRTFVAQGGPNKEWYETFRAVFDEPFFSSIESDFGRYAANGLRPLRPSPGNPSTALRRIVDSSPNCIVAEVNRTYSSIYTTPPGSPEGFIQLRLKKLERDPASKNATAWAIVSDVDAQGAQIPQDPCK